MGALLLVAINPRALNVPLPVMPISQLARSNINKCASQHLRTRIRFEPDSVHDLSECLRHVLDKAGNAQLLTPGALAALAEHSAGNLRTLMALGQDLLHAAAVREVRQIDEKLFFEVFAVTPPKTPDAKRRR